jgi:hypothetical protein
MGRLVKRMIFGIVVIVGVLGGIWILGVTALEWTQAEWVFVLIVLGIVFIPERWLSTVVHWIKG